MFFLQSSAWGVLVALYTVAAHSTTHPPCFCQASGNIAESQCTSEAVESFNNNKFLPLLKQLLERDFFRYYKVNMQKSCPFWDDDRQCTASASSGGTPHCGIQDCDNEVPIGLKHPFPNSSQFQKRKKQVSASSQSCTAASENGNGIESNSFDPLDATLSEDAREAFQRWSDHDDLENKFCDVDDDEHSADSHYVDLLRNPERYTGYKGNSAARVWQAIYRENCFKPDPKFDNAKTFLQNPKDAGMCLEKRVFFRLISGLHTSITVQVCANHYKASPFGPGEWFPNIEMFRKRFSEETTNGHGPEHLRNLYFTYLLELRALQKAQQYLSGELFYTGNEEEDRKVRNLFTELSAVVNNFENHFDETKLFQGHEAKARALKEEFRQHFLNISHIMDCVACDKCRLWGKVNTHGMGTALKILFSDAAKSSKSGVRPGRPFFQLTRNEVVALFNSIGRFASSVSEVTKLKQLSDKFP